MSSVDGLREYFLTVRHSTYKLLRNVNGKVRGKDSAEEGYKVRPRFCEIAVAFRQHSTRFFTRVRVGSDEEAVDDVFFDIPVVLVGNVL